MPRSGARRWRDWILKHALGRGPDSGIQMNWLAPGGGDYLRHGNGGDGSLPPGVFLSDILCPVSSHPVSGESGVLNIPGFSFCHMQGRTAALTDVPARERELDLTCLETAL